ncbi:hypothetical protein [Rhizobium sp.]|uniref:hypothetical protein n=1 Tax=Rhizobium sp. TaxID=391 RepID=UPI002AA86C64
MRTAFVPKFFHRWQWKLRFISLLTMNLGISEFKLKKSFVMLSISSDTLEEIASISIQSANIDGTLHDTYMARPWPDGSA